MESILHTGGEQPGQCPGYQACRISPASSARGGYSKGGFGESDKKVRPKGPDGISKSAHRLEGQRAVAGRMLSRLTSVGQFIRHANRDLDGLGGDDAGDHGVARPDRLRDRKSVV